MLQFTQSKLIVTHHAPDLDAIGATWLLKKFDSHHFADSKIAYVNPGDTISLEEAEKFGCQLHEVVHVDTGLGEFDHHQKDRALQNISATSLVFDHIIKLYPEKKDDEALQELVNFITEIDHFGEINWPDSGSTRYVFMLHELIRGLEFTDPHNDDSQMFFGLKCLDYAYASLKQTLKAEQIITSKGIEFEIGAGVCLGVETRNDDVIKRAQKKGYVLVAKKDSASGYIRIKVRPDSPLKLDKLYQKIQEIDQNSTWYYHNSGKMLLNGSHKHRSSKPSPLSLEKIISLIEEIYAKK